MNISPTLGEKIKREAKSFAIVFVYIWAILGLLALHKDFLLGKSPFESQLFAIINALVLAKVIVVLEFFRAGRGFEILPAIYRIFGKSVMYGLLLLAFHILEEGIRGWFHGRTFSQSLAELGVDRIMEIGTLSIMFIVTLVPYFFSREVITDIGLPRIRKILFDPPTRTPEPPG